MSGVIHSPAVARAFLHVPREWFLDTFYQREGRGWKCSERGDVDWLAQVYQDDALTIAINQQNMPISSSSQPSIMAVMLEALHVEPGMHVLEIGTGTGYHAALLAQLTENPACVTSIEVDAQIARRAASVLHERIGQIALFTGDGRRDQENPALIPKSYERIIVTASSPSLPRAWYESLAPGGRLVLPLEGSLQESGLLIVDKGEEKDGSGRGYFHATPVFFMALHGEEETLRPYPWLPANLLQTPATATVRIEANDPLLSALRDRACKWYLQWAWPIEGLLRISPLLAPTGRAMLRIADLSFSTVLHLSEQEDGSWQGTQRGDFPLWERLQQCYDSFLHLGQLSQDAFHVQIAHGRACLLVTCDGKERDLRDLFITGPLPRASG